MATTTVIHRDTNVEDRTDERNLLQSIVRTSESTALMITRLGLGLVMLPHGLQKMFGMFGGHGFSGTMGFFQSQGIPVIFAFLAIMAEFLGSLGLISGLLARIAAFGILCNMIVAMLMVHLPNGFFMNWSGQQAGEGFEYHILAIAMALAIIVGGAGRFSIDRSLTRR